MKPHITVITIGVDDLERALTFYRDGLGLPTAGIVGRELEHGAVAFFDLHGGLKLAVWPRDSIAHDTGLTRTPASPTDVTIGHNVGDKPAVDSAMKQAERAGARIIKKAADTAWGGYAGYFQDPDGHVWEVVWNPAFVLPGDSPQLTRAAKMTTGMLIRRPAAEVFEAFVNPEVTTRFWFTKSTGRLEVGKQVLWSWEMYGVSAPVTAKSIDPGRRIVIEWPGYSGTTTVEWTFAAQPDGTTFVEITETGFTGDGDSLLKQVADSTQGFSLVLAGAKALLEHAIRLNLVPDRYPKGIAEH